MTCAVRIWGGPLLHPMNVHPGANDRIAHTIRHFLNADEGWGRVDPKNALAPEKVIEGIKNAGWRLDEFSTDKAAAGPRDACTPWWNAPRREHIDLAHDKGYFPRYRDLIERAGAIAQPGTRWLLGGRYWRAEYDGFFLVLVELKDGFLAVSAYRSLVAKGPSQSGRMVSMADKLRTWCQTRASDASSKAVPHD